MNKSAKFLTGSALALLATIGVAFPAQAGTHFEQHQSSTSEVKVECDGDCHAKAKTSMSQDQWMDMGGKKVDDTKRSGRRWSDRRWQDDDHRDGKVTVTWTQRGGTCDIRYTEASARWYNYSTSAACDEGQATIGGLVPGRAYRFQVRKVGENWSRAVKMVAR